jgi:hypothetical protein
MISVNTRVGGGDVPLEELRELDEVDKAVAVEIEKVKRCSESQISIHARLLCRCEHLCIGAVCSGDSGIACGGMLWYAHFTTAYQLHRTPHDCIHATTRHAISAF